MESTYSVRGMTCDHCAKAVTSEVSMIDGVTGVDVDVATGRVVISSVQSVTDQAVADAVEEAGYEVVS